MGYKRAKEMMKKMLVILFAIMGLNLVANANQTYNVVVSISVEYVYYYEGREVSRENGYPKTETIPVCASSPEDAREQAKTICNNMCKRSQDMGYKMIDGKKCIKRMYLSIYDVKATPLTGDFC